MANHHGAALLMIASLLVAASLADARFAVRRDEFEANFVEVAAVPEALSCSKVHAVQKGETCYSVAMGAGLTLGQFLGFNPNINCLRVFIGQWVCLAATSA